MNPPNMKCIGGPYRSTSREEMESLKSAADSLKADGIAYALTRKKIGKKGTLKWFYLWRSPEGITRAITQRDIRVGSPVVNGKRGGRTSTSFKPGSKP